MHRFVWALATAVLWVSVWSSTATAQADRTPKDGYELFIQCSALNSTFNQGVCLGYLGAVIDQEVGAPAPRFCMPADVPLAEAQDAFVAAFDARQVPRGTNAIDAAVQVLTIQYPCG